MSDAASPERTPIAGLGPDDPVEDRPGDLRWALDGPTGGAVVRGLGFGLRKALRQCTDAVTFDRPSFEAAVAEIRPGDLVVLVPSHRSYMDFMVCSLLCFAQPELGLKLPRIAATNDFARVPVVGGILRRGGAFYIRRGVGREDPELTRQVQALARAGETLEFYIEGTRSRGRRFLEPRRGMLRALQGTGQRCVILPVAISHDALAEDASFLRELRGAPRPPSRLAPLVRWLRRLSQGHVRLGPIHLACGAPQRLDPETDPRPLARRIVAELQRQTVTTTHHLRAFLAAHPGTGFDLDGLRAAIERRGGGVLESSLAPAEPPDPLLERSYQGHWMHLFYPEALALRPEHPVVRHHVARHSFWMPERAEAPDDPRVRAVVDALFAPICRDYRAVAEHLEGLATGERRGLTPRGVVPHLDDAFLPDVEDAFGALARQSVLRVERRGVFSLEAPERLAAWRAACAWQPLPRPARIPA